MPRRPLNLLTLASLLACAVVAALWVRSYFGADELARRRGGTVWVVRSYAGWLDAFSSRYSLATPGWSWRPGRHDVLQTSAQEWADTEVRVPHAAVVAAAATLPALRRLNRRRQHPWRFKHGLLCVSLIILCLMAGVALDASDHQVAPVWFLGALSLAVSLFCARDLVAARAADAGRPPPWRLLARRNWSRQASGLCPACGYDLRASPARCPECGRPA